MSTTPSTAYYEFVPIVDGTNYTETRQEPRMTPRFGKKEPPPRKDKFIESHPPADGWRFIEAPISIRGMHCCGVREIHGIQNFHVFEKGEHFQGTFERDLIRVDAEWVVMKVKDSFAKNDERRARPVYIFTDNHDYHIDKKKGEKWAGQALLEYIVENKLGKVWRTDKLLNENSGNKIECFMWAVDWGKLLKFKPKTKEAAA